MKILQAYDRHVIWCEEKGKRLQTSPDKDMVALAKLHARTAYRPKTPNRKSSDGSGGSPSRKESLMSMSMTSPLSFRESSISRSNSRNENPAMTSSLKRTKSLGKSSGISFLNTKNHTVETSDTQFIRATTGRGSIRKGPAPTKASVLRQQVMSVSNTKHYTVNCNLNTRRKMCDTFRLNCVLYVVCVQRRETGKKWC